MASISNDPGGNRRILFVSPDGKRKAIRIGKCSKRDAESIRFRVESLLASAIRNQPVDRDTATWLEGVQPKMREKLVQAGLLAPTGMDLLNRQPTLEKFLDDYMDRYGSQRKPGTREVWRQVMENLKTYLPKGIKLSEVTAGHAKKFHEDLKASGIALTTVYKRISFARQFFNDAVDWELIDHNPFRRVKAANTSAKSNVQVSRDTIRTVLEHCDDTWKLIVALSRYGGMRCPARS